MNSFVLPQASPFNMLSHCLSEGVVHGLKPLKQGAIPLSILMVSGFSLQLRGETGVEKTNTLETIPYIQHIERLSEC